MGSRARVSPSHCVFGVTPTAEMTKSASTLPPLLNSTAMGHSEPSGVLTWICRHSFWSPHQTATTAEGFSAMRHLHSAAHFAITLPVSWPGLALSSAWICAVTLPLTIYPNPES